MSRFLSHSRIVWHSDSLFIENSWSFVSAFPSSLYTSLLFKKTKQMHSSFKQLSINNIDQSCVFHLQYVIGMYIDQLSLFVNRKDLAHKSNFICAARCMVVDHPFACFCTWWCLFKSVSAQCIRVARAIAYSVGCISRFHSLSVIVVINNLLTE